jgi:hypothetical protein
LNSRNDHILGASSKAPRAIDPEELCNAGDQLPESWKTFNNF